MHDLDVIFHSDPYPLLYHPSLANATMVCLPESPCNGGMLHVRNATRHGAALWTLAQVERHDRHNRLQFTATGRWPGQLMDQESFAAAIRVATAVESSNDDWQENFDVGDQTHPFWTTHPQKKTGERPLFGGWEHGEMTTAPAVSSAAGCPLEDPAQHAEACARWVVSVRRNQLEALPQKRVLLKVPGDAPLPHGPDEWLYAAPRWLWTHGSFSQEGWNYASDVVPPVSAVTHLLNTEIQFAEPLIGSHTGRAVQALVAGYVSPLTYLGAPKSKRLLSLQPALVRAAANHPTIAPLRALLRNAVLMAVIADLLPVMPSIPCDAPWVARSTFTPSGIYDPRLVIGGSSSQPLCYVGATGFDSCWPWDAVVWEADEQARVPVRPAPRILPSPALFGRPEDDLLDLLAWQAFVNSGTVPDVEIGNAPKLPKRGSEWGQLGEQASEKIRAFTDKCAGLVCPDLCLGDTVCDPFAGECVKRG